MKKELAFKIILIVGLIIACVAIYNDKQTIETLRNQLTESQHTVTEIGKEKQALQLEFDACCKDKDVIHAVNGVYTPEQMDEIDRKVKEQENQ